MYICICNAVTDRQIKEAVAMGATSLLDLEFELGVATGCGRCAESAMELLALPVVECVLQATEISRQHSEAANDTQVRPVAVAAL